MIIVLEYLLQCFWVLSGVFFVVNVFIFRHEQDLFMGRNKSVWLVGAIVIGVFFLLSILSLSNYNHFLGISCNLIANVLLALYFNMVIGRALWVKWTAKRDRSAL